ncbi:MAG: DNA primase [Pseudomonadota bacterium]
MSGLIPQSFIDELIARSDIVEVISNRVPLKKAGREYQACCPFHDEKTPSFTVSPNKQFYHCFGCGAHGNVIGFVIEYDRIGFVDAVEELAQKAGMTVPRDASRRDDGLQEVYAVLAEAQQTYQTALKSSPQAVEYLKQRGISGTIARDYHIGFAPEAWDTVSRWAGGNREREAILDKAGLISARSSGGVYDKFRGRIMFPIHDTRGRPIAFGGRIMGNADGPKYLNSPETPLFHKGRQLYGLYQARQAQKKLTRLLVVEGYMDVVALAQFGLTESVATLGTATTADHAEILFRAAPEIYFCFDGDRAGRQAAHRAMESVLPRLKDGRQAKFLFLPDGEDPDTLIRERGLEEFEALLAAARPLSEVFFSRYQAQVDLNSLDGRARLVEITKPLLAQIPDGAFRDMMFERLGELARSSTVAPPAPNLPPAHAGEPQDSRPAAPVQPSLVRQAVTLLVHHPGVGAVPAPVEQLIDYPREGVPLLVELYQWCRSNPGAVTAQLLLNWEGRPDHRALSKLANLPDPLAVNHNREAEFAGAIERLLDEYHRDQRVGQLAELTAKVEAGGYASLSADEKAHYRNLMTGGAQSGSNVPKS